MNVFQAVLLSLVEGLTEFLPISSTGHQILVSNLMGIGENEFVKSFEIFIQLGAILAVVFLYKDRLLKRLYLWPLLFIAFLPSGVVGLTFYKVVKSYFLENSYIVLVSLFLGGLVLVVLEKSGNYPYEDKVEKIDRKKSLIIGLFQTLSIIPGVSRAAATIVGGLVSGLSRKEAVEFSFLLSVPTIAAATGLDVIKTRFSYSSYELLLLGLGFTISFITAILAIKFFLKYVSTHNLTIFGLYRIFIAIVLWIILSK